MHTKFKTALLSVLIVSPIATFAMTDAPKLCPSVEAIKQVPYVMAQTDYWMGWIAATPTSKYDTQEEWTTAMIVGNSIDNKKIENESEAVNKANSILPSLQASVGAPDNQSGGYWCFYPFTVGSSGQESGAAYSFTPAYKGLGAKLANMQRRFK